MYRHAWCVYLSSMFVAIGAWLAADIAMAKTGKPNVVMILTDDQGWGDLSVHGNSNLATPNIDSLARDGATLDRFFVCPVCSPTRAEMLTGRYHPRGGVWSTSKGGERLDLDENTIAEAFQAAGYATGAFGKWHNGMQYPYHPNARGFDEYYGFCSGHWGHYFDPILEHNGRLVRGKGFIIDDLTDHALKFMQEHKDGPFFCYLPYNIPHSPMQVPDRFFKKFKDADLELRHREPKKENLPHTRAALAMCENIDWNVGRVLKKLDELELADDTIVIYFSDNGPNGSRWNGRMKGRKGSTDEGGVRVPCFVRWPGHVAAGLKIPQISGAIDLLPTLADLTGIKRVGKKPLDGTSLRPLLTSANASEWPDRMIFSHWSKRVSVRTQRYRLDHTGKLFDMREDPEQRQDIADLKPDVAERLRKAVAAWKNDLLPGLTADERPFPVGYPDFPVTHLPARDGQPHGNVERSARAPNCSFFTNWTNLEDRITWDIEVETPGRYEATVYYCCPKEDVGSKFELSFRDSRLQGTVSEAHDPPLVGASEDRSSRGSESYVKDFKPMRLGVMRLKKGHDELSLRAIEIPGKQVMDVRYVVLTLLAEEGDEAALAEVPVIRELKDVKLPRSNRLPGFRRSEPVVIETREKLVEVFGQDEAERIAQQVDLRQSFLILFRWAGSGQDKLVADAGGGDKPTVTFRFTPGRTRDLRPHAHLFALRRGVTWKVAP